MICDRCGKSIAEDTKICPECGEMTISEAMSTEEIARKLWIERQKERRKSRITEASKTAVKVQETEKVEIKPVNSPIADEIRDMVAELSEEVEAEKKISEVVEPDSTAEEISDIKTDLSEDESAAEDKDTACGIVSPETDSDVEQAGPQEDINREESSDVENSPFVGEGSSVHINMEQAFAEMHEQEEEFTDIRIPEVYAQAKYVPEKDSSAKWAEKAAEDEENDWEGFDPDAADWGCWSENENKSNPFVVLFIIAVLICSVGLAVYSCATSQFFTLF